MIGTLPRTLIVGDAEYPIETDFRNIFPILEAFTDPEFTTEERLYIMGKRLFRDSWEEIPHELLEEAAGQAKWFMDCGQETDDKRPPVKRIDWEQDEAIIFPAVNKIAGKETRTQEYVHWWTFMGYFMEIEEGTLSTVLGIRKKKDEGKKLEKWEEEFYRNNRKLCDLKKRYTREEQEEIDYWNELLG